MNSNTEQSSAVEIANTFDPTALLNELKEKLETGQYSKVLGICQRLIRRAQREASLPEVVRKTVKEALVCVDAHLANESSKRLSTDQTDVEEEISKPNGLIKFSKKLISEYELDLSSFPHIYLAHLHSRFRWLLYSRKMAQTTTTENWDTLIEYALAEHPELATTAIQQFLKYKDLKGIYRFFGQEIGDKYKDQVTADEVEIITSELKEMPLTNFYCKPEKVAITFVDDEISLKECEVNIMESSVTRVGLDCEWRPLSFTENTRCALIQIGTDEQVYLLDAINLPRELVAKLLISLFGSDKVVKYGYSFSSDISMLCQSYPEIEGNILCQYIDLARPQPLLVKTISPELNGTGLAALVKAVLEYDLDKKFQISDWERRPLLEGQMIYAANDAYCLLAIADGLHEIISRITSDVSALLENLIKPTITTLTSKREKLPKSRTNPVIARPHQTFGSDRNLPVSEAHVLIDPNLPKLARKLRLCGIDALIPSSTSPQHILNLITSEKSPRTFFTKTKALFNSLSSYLRNTKVNPETGEVTFETLGLCLLEANTTLEQVAEIVEKMNIRVTTRDLLSRCTKCNSNQWIRRTAKEIQQRQDFGGVRYNEFLQGSQPGSETENLHQVKRKDWIPQTVCEKVDYFIECAECKKIYWVGGHAEKVMKGMEGILEA